MLEDQGSNSYDITGAINDIPAAERGNSSIIFNEWSALTQAKQTAVVDQIVGAGVAGLFITTTSYEDENTDALWPAFAAAVSAAV